MTKQQQLIKAQYQDVISELLKGHQCIDNPEVVAQELTEKLLALHKRPRKPKPKRNKSSFQIMGETVAGKWGHEPATELFITLSQDKGLGGQSVYIPKPKRLQKALSNL